jgi:DNA-binding XRE family transcriptional regulator
MDKTIKLSEIGNRIKEHRKASGYTSYENFAIDKGFNRQTIYRAEKWEPINITTLIDILSALGFNSLEEFFKGI